MNQPLSKPTPVRLRPDTKPRLDSVAKKFGISRADIIRIAVDEKLDEWMKSTTLVIAAK